MSRIPHPEAPAPPHWSVTRLSRSLAISPVALYRRIASGELPAIRIGKVWRIRDCDAVKLIENGTR